MYKTQRTGYYIYSLLFPYVGFFLLNKIGYSLAFTIMNAQLLAIIAIAFLFGNFVKYSKFYIPYLCVFLVYFMIDSMVQGVPYFARWNNYKNAFIFLLWGSMLIDDIRTGRVRSSKLMRFFVNFLIFELSLGALQYVFEPVRDFFRNVNYMSQGEVVEVRDVIQAGFMCGTFRATSTFANFLCDCFAICATYYFCKSRLSLKSLFILGSTLVIILFAGIRASLLLSLVILTILMVKYKQRRSISLIIILMIVVFLLGGVSFDYISNLRSVNFEAGGAARSLTLFNSFRISALEEQTTFAMSVEMLPYALSNPLFGIGLHYRGGYLLNLWGVSLEEFSTTDAMLLFEIAEIGIIGMIIYLLPLLYFIKKSRELGANMFNYVLLFIIMLLSTIVDAGLMTYNYLLLFYFAVVFFIDNPEKKKAYKYIFKYV